MSKIDFVEALGIVMVIVLLVALAVFSMSMIQIQYKTEIKSLPCSSSTFECRAQQFDACMKSEQFNRAECIQLVGGGQK